MYEYTIIYLLILLTVFEDLIFRKKGDFRGKKRRWTISGKFLNGIRIELFGNIIFKLI